MGLLPTENKVYFGQLLGMCDQIDQFPTRYVVLSVLTKSKHQAMESRRLASQSCGILAKEAE